MLTRYKFAEIRTEEDLIGTGAAPGTIPTDLEQSTGLERLEILGKMEGVDIFDMRPLDSSRRGRNESLAKHSTIGWTNNIGSGTIDNPILVKSAGDEQYAGCTGSPSDSHVVHWLGVGLSRLLRIDKHYIRDA